MDDVMRWSEDQHRLAEYEVACAYWQGFRDGYARCDADVVAAIAHALGGPDCPSYGEAVLRHHRELDQREARAAWDRDATEARPGDYPGRCPPPD
jgi:hypothetical protein